MGDSSTIRSSFCVIDGVPGLGCDGPQLALPSASSRRGFALHRLCCLLEAQTAEEVEDIAQVTLGMAVRTLSTQFLKVAICHSRVIWSVLCRSAHTFQFPESSALAQALDTNPHSVALAEQLSEKPFALPGLKLVRLFSSARGASDENCKKRAKRVSHELTNFLCSLFYCWFLVSLVSFARKHMNGSHSDYWTIACATQPTYRVLSSHWCTTL